MDTNSLLESVLYYLSSAIWTSEFNKDNSSNVNPAQNNGSEYTNDTFEMRAFDWIFDWDSGEMPEPITNLKLVRRKQFYYYDSARQKYRVVKKDSGIPSKSFNTSEEALHYVNTHRGGGFASLVVGPDGLTGRERAIVAGRKGGVAARKPKE